VDFVDDVNLIFGANRSNTHFFAQVADFVNPAVAGGIDLHHVDILTGSDRHAGVADVAGLAADSAGAFKRLGIDAGGARLANAAGAGEEIGMADPARLVPGESLKLVRGPFDAVVSVSRRRISLQVAGNYAGSFPVVVGRQIRERVGSAVPVVSVRQPAAPAEQAESVAQVAWAQPGPRSIGLAEGLAIEGVADPATVTDETVPGTSLIVADRDLAELADILGQGSRVLVRQ
jgi:hypothetical protein